MNQMRLASSKGVKAALLENDQHRTELEHALGKQVDIERFVRVCANQIANSEMLQKCTFTSVLSAIITAGKLGLEPGLFGQAYLVPFRRKKKIDGRDVWYHECVCIVGYRGLIDLARRGGQIRKIEAVLVYQNERFIYERGSEERFIHEPMVFGTKEDRGPLVGVYAEAYFTSTEGRTDDVQREFMGVAEVDHIRSKSKAKNASAWSDDYEEMARKTVVRRLAKYLPLSVESQEALMTADRAEFNELVVDVRRDSKQSKQLEHKPAQSAEGMWSAPVNEVEPVPDTAGAVEPASVEDEQGNVFPAEFGGGAA